MFAAETAGEIAEMKKEIRFLAAGYQLAANAAAAAPDEAAAMVRGNPLSLRLPLLLLLLLLVLLPCCALWPRCHPSCTAATTAHAAAPDARAMCARRCGRSASVAAC